jgi:hypothetical protein
MFCDACGRQAGKAADGSVVILFPSNGQNICTDCADERHAKAIAVAQTNVKSELIAAFDAYREVSVEIIAQLLAERGESSSVSTRDTKSLHSMREQLRGVGRKKKPRVTSPSQAAAAHEAGRRRRGALTYEPSKPKDAPVERSSYEMAQELYALQQSLSPKAQAKALGALIDSKIAAVFVPDERAVVSAFFDQSYVRPSGYSSFEEAERQVTKAYEINHPSTKSARRKFQV